MWLGEVRWRCWWIEVLGRVDLPLFPSLSSPEVCRSDLQNQTSVSFSRARSYPLGRPSSSANTSVKRRAAPSLHLRSLAHLDRIAHGQNLLHDTKRVVKWVWSGGTRRPEAAC